MRALLRTPAGFRLDVVPDPEPGPGEVVVGVRAASVNYLDVGYDSHPVHAQGRPPGVDAAGEVVVAAADGSGPPVGSRVAGFGFGTWAERVALPVAEVAVVPEGVDSATAAALTAAGVTALRAVRALGAVLGRRVLVTGASGGVGRFAVRLAELSGAHVVALTGRPDAVAGSAEVVGSLDGVAPVDAVLDNAGGPVLGAAFALLRPGGTALSVGAAAGSASTIDFEEERRRGGGRRIEPFVVGGAMGEDLGVLLDLVARGRLDAPIGWRGSWERADEAAAALLERRVDGKAVLEIS